MNLFDPKNIIGAIGSHEYIGVRLAYQFVNLEATKLRYDQVVQMLTLLGMSEFCPHRPSPPDVFRRLTSKLSGYFDQDGYRQKVDIIRVADDKESVERVVMLVEVDQENKEVSDGRKVARLTFDKEFNRFEVIFGPFGTFDYCPDWLRNMINECREQYDSAVNYLSSQQVRDIAVKVLTAAGNPVRKISSLWNIPASREFLAEKMENFARDLNELAISQNPGLEKVGGILFVDTMPIVNTLEQRKKISADAVAFAVEKLQKTLYEQQDNIAFAADPDKAKAKAKARLQAEADSVMELVEEYELLLGEVMDEVRQAREITEKNLKTFCEDPIKQADHKRAVQDRKGGKRRLQKVETITVTPERPVAPSRRFNMQPMAGVM
jgi:hypothetical protein